jgi:protein-disulfide isomerase
LAIRRLIWFYIRMTSPTRKLFAGLILTLLPVISVYSVKQTAWGKFQATPKSRQEGDPGAKVLLVEYSDFQCPMCASVQPTLKFFMEHYKGRIRLAYKYFPLTKIHKNAIASAHAAECAASQDKFWPYSEQLFANQPLWANLNDPTTSYVAIAQSVQLDMGKFKTCYADPSKEAIIEQDHAEGEARQINATPTLFIGDERLVGTPIMTDGARMIERELKK